MSTILAYTSPALGHLFPMTPLLLELASRGHRVHVRTLPEQVGPMTSLGLEASSIDRRIRELPSDDYSATNPRDALKLAVSVFTRRATLDAPDLEDAIGKVRPDALVVDINTWGALTVAEASGLPFAMFSPYTPPLRSRGTPPFGPGLKPLPGLGGRLRDGLLRPLVIGAAEKIMTPPVNELRTRHGLAPVADADAFLRRAPLVLVTTAEPFEYHHDDWGEQVAMIGPCAWEPPAEPPAWVAELPTDRPLVLVNTSSEFQDDGRLVRAALAGLADEDLTVVATMPSGREAGLEVPANARVEEFVPHGPLLERADVVVTHGGMGSTQKALARGVPVVVVPFGRDQPEVARRAEVSGAGVRLPVRRLDPTSLRDAVRAARGLRAGAARVARGYAEAGGPARGASLVEERLLAPASGADGLLGAG